MKYQYRWVEGDEKTISKGTAGLKGIKNQLVRMGEEN